MSVRVISMQGDTVDLICHRHYGYTQGITEQVLTSNPGLSQFGPILPLGTSITLPEIPVRQEHTLINLWD